MDGEPVTPREEILRRVRKANGPGTDARAAGAGWEAIRRGYKRAGSLAHREVLDLFEGRLRDYDATVVRCVPQDVARHVQERFLVLQKRRIVVPRGVSDRWLPATGFDFVADDGLTAAELDSMDGVLTESSAGIAETGTIVLQNVPGQGRRAASLVPDYHLCLVRAEDVVETVPEAFERLRGRSKLPTTFISGPSATADIEMTRIKGVHGPRVLDVLLVVGRNEML